MARISRKQLKEDRFAQEVGESVQYFSAHRKQILVWVVIAAVLVTAGFGYWHYESQRETEARHAFQRAMNLYYGKVAAEPQVGVITFATNVERFSRATAALEEVQRDFANRREGLAAGYYLALLDLEQNRQAEGREKLEAAAAGSDEEMSSLAHLALGGLLEEQGDQAGALPHYQHLVDHPTVVVPKQRGQLRLAALLAETDPEKAKPLLEELRNEPSQISARAASILARMEPQEPSP